jgi:hypothetical protein
MSPPFSSPYSRKRSRFHRLPPASASKCVTCTTACASNVPSHHTHPPELSFAGFDSFTEVKRGFEFHDNRPNSILHQASLRALTTTSASPCSALHLFRHMLVSCPFTMCCLCLAHQGTSLCPHLHCPSLANR